MKSKVAILKDPYHRMRMWHARGIGSWAGEVGFWLPIAAIYLKDAFVI